jgi:hypothetical protein
MVLVRVGALALAAALAACGGESPAVKQTPRTAVEVGSFIGEYSAATGTLKITPNPTSVDPISMGLTFTGSLEEIPVHQNGLWNDVEEGAVEMRTVGGTVQAYAGGCPGDGLFVADVEIHSGFRNTKLVRTYVEITSVPTGFESCLGVPSPPLSGITGVGGIFAYPDLDANGYGTATWSFRLPNTSDFRFIGKVWAEKIGLVPPGTTASLAAGSHAAPQTLTLTCVDTGSGCADTFYTVNGGATQPYTRPIHVSGNQTICYWSQDLRENIASQTCRSYTVTADLVTATYDSALGVPRCSTIASSCSTGTLVQGRGATETGAPNTLDHCADGDFLGDEAINRITVATQDGGPLAPGKGIRVTADVNIGDPGDFVNIYWSPSASSPSWTLLGSPTFSSVGVQSLTLDSTLPAGAVAIRAQIAYGSPAGACAVDGYQDQDDLVFVQDAPTPGAATATITSPVSGADVSRQALLTATASDDTAVVSMEFQYLTGDTGATWQTIAIDTSPPWAVVWNTNTATYGVNTAQLRVLVTDTAGDTNNLSLTVPITIRDRTAPTVSVTSPLDGDSLNYAVGLVINASAADVRNVRNVYFYVDGALVSTQDYTKDLGGGTYTFTVDVSGFSLAYPHTVFVRADDYANNVGQSPIVHFTVF